MNKATIKSSATRIKKTPSNIWKQKNHLITSPNSVPPSEGGIHTQSEWLNPTNGKVCLQKVSTGSALIYNLSVWSFFPQKRPYGLASQSLALMPGVTGGSNGAAETEEGGANQGGTRWMEAKKAINPINCSPSKLQWIKSYILPATVMKGQA